MALPLLPSTTHACLPTPCCPQSYLELISFQSDLLGPCSPNLPYEITAPMWEVEVGGWGRAWARRREASSLVRTHGSQQVTQTITPPPTSTPQLALRLNLCAALTRLGRGREGVEVLRETRVRLPDGAKVWRVLVPRLPAGACA